MSALIRQGVPGIQRFISFILVTIQTLGIPLVAGLFICAVTGELNNQRLTLEWPFLIDANSPLLDTLLLSIPSMLLYAASVRVLKNPYGELPALFC
ncbi:hypothetical protein [Pseudomonas sp. NPDC079086]|uniref:hypothetical protein n=1 Tax=unclassified Pseudomonas TaxID=196821 RepID=UPI0037C92ECC